MRKQYLFLPLLALLLALTVLGCGVPQKDYAALQQQLAAAQKDLDSAKSQLTAAQSQISQLQGQVNTQTGNLNQSQTQVASLQKQVADLTSQVNTILDTRVTEYYDSFYQFVHYDWVLPIPLKNYFYYKNLAHPSAFAQYGTAVTDTNGDSVLAVLVNAVKDSELSNNLNQINVINLMGFFVQTLPHSNQDVTTPYDPTPLFPLETIFIQGGDSADNSILAAALLKRLGFGVVLFNFEAQQHMAVGVNMPTAGGYSWEYQSVRYFYLETTGKGWQVGDMPTQYKGLTPTIIPIGS